MTGPSQTSQVDLIRKFLATFAVERKEKKLMKLKHRSSLFGVASIKKVKRINLWHAY